MGFPIYILIPPAYLGKIRQEAGIARLRILCNLGQAYVGDLCSVMGCLICLLQPRISDQHMSFPSSDERKNERRSRKMITVY